MNGAISLLLAAAAGPAPAALPDIEIAARVKAREVRIRQQGRASAEVRIEPEAAKQVQVDRNLPKGQSSYRNLDLTLKVKGRLADPLTLSTDVPRTGD
ncbi:hypothetical protein GRI75_09080 [Altererythrobacter soli]|uniref:Uncharacterized protein n=1 Tax=Croceibacterium soli TaxID=1739690 RepID=A0A6I4USA5_9SPHN|nr:hypothetical protein [Croceibacterium soli]MXP41792.1 hypothetical protein [Croceibacterium soli]